MKVAVVGCGAVGSFYGGCLARAGHEVHFLLRSDYETVLRQGLSVRSPLGDFQVRPRCARSPEEIGPAELVLIGLKTTANHQFPRLLPPLVGPATAVLTLQNGLGNEEALARLFPPRQVMGGLCFVCLNRLQPGLVHHIDHGLIVLGEFQRPPEPRTHTIAGLFSKAGVPCNISQDLAFSHWEKLTWNIPFNGLGVAGVAGLDAVLAGHLPEAEISSGSRLPSALSARAGAHAGSRELPATLTTDRLLSDPQWTQLLRELMLEVIRAGQAMGFDIPESLVETQLARTRTMGAYKASTLIDFERGQPLELDSLFLEPLRLAERAGVPVPRLKALCALLGQLDPGSVSGLS